MRITDCAECDGKERCNWFLESAWQAQFCGMKSCYNCDEEATCKGRRLDCPGLHAAGMQGELCDCEFELSGICDNSQQEEWSCKYCGTVQMRSIPFEHWG